MKTNIVRLWFKSQEEIYKDVERVQVSIVGDNYTAGGAGYTENILCKRVHGYRWR